MAETDISKPCGNCGIKHNRRNKNRIQSYCHDCHAAYMRGHNIRHSEKSPLQKKKVNARSYANVYQKRGKLIKKSCEICGCESAEKHHEDYNLPVQVKWICRKCHLDLHQKTETEHGAAVYTREVRSYRHSP